MSDDGWGPRGGAGDPEQEPQAESEPSAAQDGAQDAVQDAAEGPAEETARAAAVLRGAAQRGPVVGVVLGAGAARGWSHIGVLEALEDMGLKPQIVVGCSSGAVVAAAYAAGRLEPLKGFASSLTWRGMLGYFDFSWRGGGLIEGKWLVDFFEKTIGDHLIETLPVRYGSVATELSTGRETWFTRGSTLDAVRASIALPGLITPIAIDGRWMVDGALANPIPVSLCRALGAEVIIGVSMSGDLVSLGRSPLALSARADASEAPPKATEAEAARAEEARAEEGEAAAAQAATARQGRPPAAPEDVPALRVERAPATNAAESRSSWLAWLTGYGGGGWSSYWAGAAAAERHPDRPAETPLQPAGRPGYFDVIGQSFFSAQNFVSRVRLAADPVDVLVVPEVEQIGIMDFHRGAEAIAAGRAAVEAKAELIAALCGLGPSASPTAPAPLEGPSDPEP